MDNVEHMSTERKQLSAERARSEESYAAADREDIAAREQVRLLEAIYHELRHGHDQQAKQMKLLDDLTDTLDRVARHLGDR